MSESDPHAIVRALLDRHGRSFADELRLDLASGSRGLWGLAVFSLLASSRIRTSIALDAARALLGAGLGSPAAMAAAEHGRLVRLLDEHSAARYDERTASILVDAAAFVGETYNGDLRKLRDAADRDRDREAELLQELKGIGPTAAEAFLREVQVVWDEVAPFVGPHAMRTAKRLGLPAKEQDLLALVRPAEVPRLAAALIRAQVEGTVDEVRDEA